MMELLFLLMDTINDNISNTSTKNKCIIQVNSDTDNILMTKKINNLTKKINNMDKKLNESVCDPHKIEDLHKLQININDIKDLIQEFQDKLQNNTISINDINNKIKPSNSEIKDKTNLIENQIKTIEKKIKKLQNNFDEMKTTNDLMDSIDNNICWILSLIFIISQFNLFSKSLILMTTFCSFDLISVIFVVI
ncbi:unnamed protein product [marine sediment metagenome]|uniref:Uncharacterized protein n=1 Tax=marine sediment metagenome TaxID=412755 RepID=X1BZY6_9ZZZZ